MGIGHREPHGVAAEPTDSDVVDGYPHRVWADETGRAVIEEYSITGMGHGTPLDTAGAEGCGSSGAYMLETGISSTAHLCRFWGIADPDAPVQTVAAEPRVAPATPNPAILATRTSPMPVPAAATQAHAGRDIGRVIEAALRAGGLMR